MKIQNNISFAGDQQRLNIFYFSDYHGDVPAYKELKTASDEFDSNHKDTQNLKLTGGDLVVGEDSKKRLLVYRLLKLMNIDASAVGNHEWDKDTNFYQEVSNLYKKAPNLLFNKFICGNTETPKKNEYKEQGLFQSKVIVKNGEKYGIIGAVTGDYKFNDCNAHDINGTKQDITVEIQELKKKDPSLNKFILLSHLGIDADRAVAKTVPDIDIIVGGHSHTLINGVEPDKNLFISSKNEPVLIIQAGNERYFGELGVEFDKEGRIDLSKGHEPINTTKSIFDYKENKEVKDNEEKILGPSSAIGVLNEPIRMENPLKGENPLGDMDADAIWNETKSDFVILNAGSFRASLSAGKITKRDLEYCMPFLNKVITIKCTGKDIANLLTLGSESTKHPEQPDPGLFQIAGIKYTISADKKLTDVYTVDKNGNKSSQIVDSQGNIVPEKNPDSPKEYTVAMTDHVITRFFPKLEMSRDYIKKDGYKIVINKEHIIKEYGADRDILEDYMKHNFTDKNRPIEINKGRITIENSDKAASYSFVSLIHKHVKPD